MFTIVHCENSLSEFENTFKKHNQALKELTMIKIRNKSLTEDVTNAQRIYEDSVIKNDNLKIDNLTLTMYRECLEKILDEGMKPNGIDIQKNHFLNNIPYIDNLCNDSIILRQYYNSSICENIPVVQSAASWSGLTKIFKSSPRGLSIDTAVMISNALDNKKWIYFIGAPTFMIGTISGVSIFQKLTKENPKVVPIMNNVEDAIKTQEQLKKDCIDVKNHVDAIIEVLKSQFNN